MAGRTILITGGTRGIGAAIVSILQADEGNKIIVGVRNTNAKLAKELAQKANVTIVKIDSEDEESPFAAAKQLEKEGVEKIDVVYANAGIAGDAAPVSQTKAKALLEKVNVNAVAPLLLFEAFKPFLQKSDKPIFNVTSSLIGSIAAQEKLIDYPVTAYAVSKVAVNMVVKRIALEETWLTAFVFHPGLVISEMSAEFVSGEAAAQMIKDGSALTTEDSARRIVELVNSAELATHSGHFFDVHNGGEIAW